MKKSRFKYEVTHIRSGDYWTSGNWKGFNPQEE